jgi:carboxyl-terminal processing protease
MSNLQTSPQGSVIKKDILMPFLLSLAMATGIFVGMKLKNEPLISISKKKNDNKASTPDIIGQGRIEEILRYIEAKYIDEINDDALVDKSINNLLLQLDPHSVFIPAQELKEASEELDGLYEGIGIEAMMLDDTLTIVTPLTNSPAAVVGLQSGDKIMAVNDSSALQKDIRWLNSKLKGKKGTTVKVSILRGEQPNRIKQYTLTRDKVPLYSVDVAMAMDEMTGYIKISRFSTNTTREFLEGLEKLFEKKGVKNLIIDLRQNPGGYLDKAVDVLSQLFPEKEKLLVYTKGRTVHRNEYKTNGRNRYEVGKVAILIDEGSASASEIVAGAVQDWDRGLIIGRRSFGKGLVQEPYQLKDGSELRLTVAKYFTPTGRSIQKPYKDKTRKEYQDEEEKRFERGELTKENIAEQTDTVPFFTASGRVVYGGGGVIPDYFVAIDPISKNEYFQSLKIWIQEYGYRYYSLYKKDIRYKEWQDFQKGFTVTDYAFNEFLKYSERQGIPRQPAQLVLVREPVKRLLKARIARLLYGEEGYYGILNDNDAMINTTLEILRQDDPLGLKKLAVRKR